MDSPGNSDFNFKHNRIASWVFILFAIIVSLIYFKAFLQPLVLAVMIWYFIFELKRIIGKLKIKGRPLPKWITTILAFGIIFLFLLGIYEILRLNLELVIDKAPFYISNGEHLIQSIKTLPEFSFIQERVLDMLNEFNFSPLFSGILNGLSSLTGNSFIIIIYVIFLMAEEKFFYKKIDLLLRDKGGAEKIISTIEQVTQAVRTYIIVKTQMSLLTGGLSYVVLLLFGVDFPVLWAFLIFLLNFIPYLGSFVATLLPAIFSAFQFETFWMLFWVFICIQGVQILVGNFIETMVMGKTLNLSPLGVLLALSFWGIIWGVLGMIISVPVTSILIIVAAQFPSTRFISVWLSETGEVSAG